MKKILILFGGSSYEHDISIMSAKSIIDNINTKKFVVTSVIIDHDNKWYIVDKIDEDFKISKYMEIKNIIEFLKSFDKIFPIIHGADGEDGKLQALFELFNIDYVGCNYQTNLLGFDKELTNMIFKEINVPHVKYIVTDSYFDLKKINRELNFPLIIKPCRNGSSIGISKANNNDELILGIKEAINYDDKIIIEEFINAYEYEIAVLNSDKLIISNIGEIIKEDLYDYNSKYVKKVDSIINKNISLNLKNEMIEYVKRICKKFNIKDMVRVDFLYDYNNQKLYVNEINTIPGFTDISMFPKLMMDKKISYQKLITKLLS